MATTPAAPPLTGLWARELAPPAGIAPIEWLLLTTWAVVTAADAARIVTGYRYRWRIARWHFTLQTRGSHVEDLQLKNRERLERALTRYSILSWRLLGMTYPARIDPDPAPTGAVSPAEIAVGERLATTPRPIRAAGPPLTLRDAVRARAKLGGFLGRNRDGEPGVKTCWRGYRQLPWRCWWDAVSRNPS